ncbi:hypothetical protein ACFIJ5_05480 [Haloimpatiens sp. FM7330]|uniref:hypothetical protein n=1 Tax=Haloimpatiens sp. FM7330 TaxID=3298610 RepID=UPI00362D0A25
MSHKHHCCSNYNCCNKCCCNYGYGYNNYRPGCGCFPFLGLFNRCGCGCNYGCKSIIGLLILLSFLDC